MRLGSFLLDLLFPLGRDALIVRALTKEQLLQYLKPVPLMLGSTEVVALLPYRKREIGALIREAKFRSNTQAYELLGTALNEYLFDHLADRFVYEERPIALVPIPLSKKRYRERGYNQVEEVLKRVHLPSTELTTHVLKRTRDTKAQTSLSRDGRLRNVSGAFTATSIDPHYLYILVDDVMTTGATLSDAVRALTDAGARHVLAITLSH